MVARHISEAVKTLNVDTISSKRRENWNLLFEPSAAYFRLPELEKQLCIFKSKLTQKT